MSETPMVYVERDGEGAIKGVYRNPQEGIPVEELPDDDPEVAAYRRRIDEQMAALLR